MSTNGIERHARILVALSATADTRIELALYRYLLGEAPPEIVGLVVEDPALLAHAGSGLAREIVLSGLERRLDLAALERQLRARTAEWRRALEAESARLGVRVALETVRDERRAALARAAERADALVVEAGAVLEALEIWTALPPQAPLRTLVLTPARPRGADIVVVTDEPAPGTAMDSPLAAALRIARRTGARLTVLDAARRRTPEALARELVELGVRLGGYAPLEAGRVDAPTLAAYAAHAGLLVLPAAPSADPVLVTELAARLRGALMLLRRGAPTDKRIDT